MNHLILPAIAETEIELTFKLRLKEAVYHELAVHEASDASSEIRKAEQGDNAPSQVLGPMGVSHFSSLEQGPRTPNDDQNYFSKNRFS